jgi:hypothetical protein
LVITGVREQDLPGRPILGHFQECRSPGITSRRLRTTSASDPHAANNDVFDSNRPASIGRKLGHLRGSLLKVVIDNHRRQHPR